MLSRCATVLLPDAAFIDPQLMLQLITRHQLTQLFLTPSILGSVLRGTEPAAFTAAFQSIRTIWLTGESVRAEIVHGLAERSPHVELLNCYSTNETGDLAMCDVGKGSLSEYTLFDDIETNCLEPTTGRPVPVGCVGALHVRCCSLYVGYWSSDGVRRAHSACSLTELAPEGCSQV